jgi:hypothetical protein
LRVGRATPSGEVIDNILGQLGYLIERQQIVRNALVPLLIPWVGHSTKLDQLVGDAGKL